MAGRHPTYNDIKNDAATVRFSMNEVVLLVFGMGEKRYHLTEALNGCFAVFLISPKATVSAHIPPHPGANWDDSQAGNKNLIAKMKEFAALYRENEQYFHGHKVALIYAVLHGKTQLPDKKEFIEKCLREFQVDFPLQDYEVKSPGQNRSEEHGTAFVDGKAVTGPALYLQDQLVLRVFASRIETRDVLTGPAKISTPKPTPQQPPAGSSIVQVVHSNPIFPRAPTSAAIAPPATQQESKLEIVPKATPALSSSFNKISTTRKQERVFTHVKSKLDWKSGGRIVEIDSQTLLIGKEDWEQSIIQGNKVWVSKKFGLSTDF
ncbi:hypothetical protein Z517_04250 [Fonsecaea pedrosoi CBS 271.37]|uniref:Uncharacterized protein n=1 Tax=Fonsecaea pedrosoi CBS 271.37 TaxID=1442368 RepID=A0A0D2GRM1_9EURO|nr:uncharacterized protein Z517_04250 [Fonsecaea pedrosoi CBS 271.37]KIW81225.1 hypothetical protein Z517_04250 [Fonsecaea pedrosoi CBS 271.37]